MIQNRTMPSIGNNFKYIQNNVFTRANAGTEISNEIDFKRATVVSPLIKVNFAPRPQLLCKREYHLQF